MCLDFDFFWTSFHFSGNKEGELHYWNENGKITNIVLDVLFPKWSLRIFPSETEIFPIEPIFLNWFGFYSKSVNHKWCVKFKELYEHICSMKFEKWNLFFQKTTVFVLFTCVDPSSPTVGLLCLKIFLRQLIWSSSKCILRQFFRNLDQLAWIILPYSQRAKRNCSAPKIC